MPHLEKGSDLSWKKFYIELATYRVKEKYTYDRESHRKDLIKEYDKIAEKEGKPPYDPKDSEYIWKQNGMPEYLTREEQEAYDHWFKDECYREWQRACKRKREEKARADEEAYKKEIEELNKNVTIPPSPEHWDGRLAPNVDIHGKPIVPPAEERDPRYIYDELGVIIGRVDEDTHDIYGVPLDNPKDNDKFKNYKRNSSI